MKRNARFRKDSRSKMVKRLFDWNMVWSWRDNPDGALLDAKKRADNRKECGHLRCKNVRRANKHRKGPGLTKQEVGNAASAEEDLKNIKSLEDLEGSPEDQ